MENLRPIDVEELKKIQLEILNTVADFCDKNGIKYWLDFGTLLGAIRHKGYIPWDDDIDVSMLRSDYDKFIELFNSENTRYKFCSYETDKKFYYAFGKVIDTQTVIYEPDRTGNKLAVNIDIFPFENVPDAKTAAKLYKKRDRCNIMDTARKHRGRARGGLLRRMSVGVLKLISKLFSRGHFVKKIVKNAAKYKNVDTEYVADLSGNVSSFVLDKKLFCDLTDAEFENGRGGGTFKIPVAYDKVLTAYYGDYMTPPPEDERVSHHKFEAYYIV